MTLGQRIVQKRKELGLSQEGLGEQLNVSRQAIYKWESDASLPEIEKLITLSKIFSVSVGWLLGVEEAPPPSPSQESGELTEAQLNMVQEIVDRYLAARPKPAPPKHTRLVRLCGAAAVLVLIATLFSLFSKLDRVTQEYNNLQYSVYDIDRNVNSQIGSITSRVESILKSQNNLTAEWSAELASTDLAANTATFDVRVVPRTYVEGMTALFVARSSGEDTVELPVEPGEDHTFSAQITCPLSDQIDLSVVLITGDKRETQWLNDFYGLYEETFPWLTLRNDLWFSMYRQKDNTLPAFDSTTGPSVEIWNDSAENHFAGWDPDPPAKIQVGLFQDRKLVQWYEGRTHTVNWDGVPTEEFAWFRIQEVTLEPGHIYCEAAIYTDEYGRQRVYEGEAIEYSKSEQGWETPSGYQSSSDPADWSF